MKENNEAEVIRISMDSKVWLDSLKVHPNQSYAEVLDKIRTLLGKDKTLKETLDDMQVRTKGG